MDNKLIYTAKEAAKIIHCSPNYIYELIEEGYLPAIKLGSIKILRTTLEQFLIENEGCDLSDINSVRKVKPANIKESD